MSAAASMTPLGFAKVQEGIYRSAYPASKALPFIEQLGLRSFICLSPNDVRPDLEEFCANKNIHMFKFDLKHNQDPFLIMDESLMRDIQHCLQQPENLPLLIFCTAGKIRTGCVVGCYRKHQKWSMSSIIAEFEQFTEPDGSLCDMHFIDAYEPTEQSFVNLAEH